MVENKASVCAYISAAWGVLMGITVQEFALWVGICTGVGTFCINWWYKHKADVREAERHAARD